MNRVSEHAIGALLDVPPVLDIHTLVPVGYPDYKPKPSYRRKLEEIVHYDRYDRSKYRTGKEIVDYLRDLRKRMSEPYAQEFSAETGPKS